jgi:hypothetical protein
MLSDSLAMAGTPDDRTFTLRQFAGQVGGDLRDQNYGDEDGSVDNPTGQFVAVGPRSMSVEGQPFYLSGSASVSPVLLLLLVAAGVWFLKKG